MRRRGRRRPRAAELRARAFVAALDDDVLTATPDDDWASLASLAADRTTRPPVAYEPADPHVV